MRRYSVSAAAILLASLTALAGCDLPPPRGPAWGEWKGSQPGAVTYDPRQVHLTLEGAASAPMGRYDVSWIAPDPGLQVDIGEHRWAGTYGRQQQNLNGKNMTVIVLRDAPPAVVDHYALFPDGTLHALQPGDGLGSPKLDALYTLYPVTPAKP